MEKLLQEFYEAHPRQVWWSESLQIRKFSEWARSNGYDVELSFVDGKRTRILTLAWIALAISIIALFTIGWKWHRMNIFPVGLIVLLLLPIMSKRTPILTRAQSGRNGD